MRRKKGIPLEILWRFHGESFNVKKRSWLGARFGVYSEPRHLAVARYIAGIQAQEGVNLKKADRKTKELKRIGRGVCLFYPVRNEKREKISIGFTLVYPENALGFMETLSVQKR